MSDQPRINVPQMCGTHQSLLVHQCGYTESDPWRSLVIMAQIALFQASTTDASFFARAGDDLARIADVGCLACFKPDAFGEIVHAVQTKGPGAIKALGESWVRR